MKILYLYDHIDIREKEKNINLINADVIVVPMRYLSTRENNIDMEVLGKIEREYSKEVYLLLDKPLSEKEKIAADISISSFLHQGYKILFSDFYYYQKAKKLNLIDNLIYYSPTLLLNPLEIEAYISLGIKHFIISKECEYDGYIDILKKIKNASLGMLCLGYPQLYMSKRLMLTLNHPELNKAKKYYLKEKTRDQYYLVKEDQLFYIFADRIFFPYQYLKEFNDLGMEYYYIDSNYLDKKIDYVSVVRKAINGEKLSTDEIKDTFNYLLKQVTE